MYHIMRSSILAFEHSMIRLIASTFIDECHLHASHYIIKFVASEVFWKVNLRRQQTVLQNYNS